MTDTKLLEHRDRWEAKPVLRAIYEDFHHEILARCVPGRILEIGSGSGHIAQFVQDVVQLDILPAPWLDLVADAQRLPFADSSFDNIVMLDVLHHIEYPRLFLAEAQRVLRPGGRIVMVEPGITPFSWPFYNFVHVEDVDMGQDPLATGTSTDPNKDAWESNQALPTLLFGRRRGRRRVEQSFPGLRVLEHRWLSLWAYPLSGGFQPWCLLPQWGVRPLLRLERWLLALVGPVLAFRIVATVEKASA